MKRWKMIGKRLLFLPLWQLVILAVSSAAALSFVFIKGWETKPAASVVYAISFYTLTVISAACYRTISSSYRRFKRRLYENKYTGRYLTDAVYNTHISLLVSLVINLLYVGINAVLAVIYNTYWFAIFSIYYGSMAVMRFLLVWYVGKNPIGESRLGELKRARTCAYILMTVNIVLSGVVLMMVYYDRGFEYQGFFIYVMAMYTFYVTISALMDVIRYRRYHSPILSVTKIIKLTAALFSMLFLETAMFAQFGQDTAEQTKRIMIMATGAGISVIVVGMSAYMIIRSSKEIRKYKTSLE